MKEDYLEIIKQNEPKQVWDQEDGDFYLLFVPEMWDKVIDAATEMDAEIKILEDKIITIHANYYQTLEWHEKE